MDKYMTNRLLELKGVSVYYDKTCALGNVDLTIYINDFIGIIGPNGGGKTSLIKAILELIPYRGKIEYNELYLKKRAIGYLPQQNNFDKSFPISMSELILSGLQSTKGMKSSYSRADKELAKELMQKVGILKLAKKAIGELSGGELQRGLLCRAIISKPKLLILDEPTNFVDNKFEQELYSILTELNKNMAIIVVSHDLGTITSVVKSIVCVNRSVHRHDTNVITTEMLENYNYPIQIVVHGKIPHTVLENCHCRK